MQEKPAPVYLDYNASAPVSVNVAQAVAKAMVEGLGNASSVHGFGRMRRAEVEAVRKDLARMIGVETKSVVFCSGGTEANMSVLSPHYKGYDLGALFVSAIEHPSVLAGGSFEPNSVLQLPVLRTGQVDVTQARVLVQEWCAANSGRSFLLSVMAANNETGVLQPIKELSDLVHEFGGILHVDGAQVVGRTPIDAKALGIDLFTLSAHKFGAPKGIGAFVFVNEGLFLSQPLLKGGGQERGARAGTENTPAIVGLGVALRTLDFEAWEKVGEMRDDFEDYLAQNFAHVEIVGKNVPRISNTTCVVVHGALAETLLMKFDLAGFALSSGSACSSGSLKPSHVLKAMGFSEIEAKCGLRFSFGPSTTKQEIELLKRACDKIFAK